MSKPSDSQVHLKGSEDKAGSKDTTKPPRKTRKTKAKTDTNEKRTVKKVRGILQRLKEFSLDIVFEIFAHLTPRDLLSLSRTTKEMRSLLLNRATMNPVWKAARENVDGLLGLPEDMSEVAYAHLCFDKSCFHCSNRRPAVHVLWHCRTRCCHGCLDSSDFFFTDTHHTMKWEIEQKKGSAFWKLLEYHADSVYRHKVRVRGRHFFVMSASVYKQLSEEWEASKDDEQWKQTKVAEAQAKDAHARALKTWWDTKSGESPECKQKARAKDIVKRLADCGWAREIDLQRKWNGLRCLERYFTVTTKVTSKEWEELKYELEDVLECAEAARIGEEEANKWKERYPIFHNLVKAQLDKLPSDTVKPGVADIIDSSTEFGDLFFCTDLEEELNEKAFDDIFPSLPEMCNDWVLNCEQDLFKVLEKSGIENPTTETLHLCTTTFSCTHCNRICRYPQLLVHCCRTVARSPPYRCTTLDLHPSLEGFMQTTDTRLWSADDYRLDLDKSRAVKPISL